MQSKQLFEVDTDIIDEIITGLKNPNKMLPCKLFYDERGSQLFDEICELNEYYPTRTELKILEDNIDEISSLFKHNSLFIEFGSGSSLKTRLLLSHIKNLAGYVPIDISEEHLMTSVETLEAEYPGLDIYPLAADYTQPLELPSISRKVDHKITFFPGSTIGNFTKVAAKKFLKIIAEETGENGGLLIGVDLKKDHQVLSAAYNDKRGVTAEFNLNILHHLNREYGFDFDVNKFEHYAFYNEKDSRIEMHLKSLTDQIVHYDDGEFFFDKGETILTEYSNKYSLEKFADLAFDSFNVERIWIDDNKYFSVQYLSVK